MSSLTRRHFAAACLAAPALAALPYRPSAARAVIVGGGPAGATAAIWLARSHPGTEVLLIERDPKRLAPSRSTFPFAPDPSAGPGLDVLRHAGVEVALDEVMEVDWTASRVSMLSGRKEPFDNLVLAPGTSPVEEPIPGLDAHARHHWPAAWGSRREARRLAAQLESLPERGHVVLRLPANMSHPEAARDRAHALGRWLATHRPQSRLTILDGSNSGDMEREFLQNREMPMAQIDWRRRGKGGEILSIDAKAGHLMTESGRLSADIVNFVVPHRAGQLAHHAGLTDDSGWCPCTTTGRSKLQPAATVIGDARHGTQRTAKAALIAARRAVQAI